MNWSSRLSPEERHVAKVGDLDALERIVLNSGDEIDVAGSYERIFEALHHRANTSNDKVLSWGERYIAWAEGFTERDGLPFLGTVWAKHLFERSMSSQRPDIARSVADAILRSYAPLEKEQRWWMKQHYALEGN